LLAIPHAGGQQDTGEFIFPGLGLGLRRGLEQEHVHVRGDAAQHRGHTIMETTTCALVRLLVARKSHGAEAKRVSHGLQNLWLRLRSVEIVHLQRNNELRDPVRLRFRLQNLKEKRGGASSSRA